jgi:hypothetical protein
LRGSGERTPCLVSKGRVVRESIDIHFPELLATGIPCVWTPASLVVIIADKLLKVSAGKLVVSKAIRDVPHLSEWIPDRGRHLTNRGEENIQTRKKESKQDPLSELPFLDTRGIC